MATTTPNIGLTKPVLTENVSLTVINDNYDKIDTEFGKLTDTFKIEVYNCTIASIAPGGIERLSGNDFDMHTPDGYTPLCPSRIETWNENLLFCNVQVYGGSTPVMVIVNNSSETIENASVNLGVVYVKSSVL